MRTTKGAARTRAKNRLFKKVKGFVGGRGRLLRTAKESLIRSGVYAFRDRRNRKRDFRKLWIIRINAAVRAARNPLQRIHRRPEEGATSNWIARFWPTWRSWIPQGFATVVEAVKKSLAAN